MRLILIALLLLMPVSAQAQEPPAGPGFDALQEELGQTANTEGLSVSDIFPDASVRALLNADGEAALQRSLQAYYDYRAQGFEHRARVFAWQHLSTIVIFGMVMLIVGLGLYFSWMQFRGTKPGDAVQDNTIEIGTTGVKITSPVLGVVILTLSLAFFYLYLIHVYPVVDSL